jgi:hypothetical protein
MGRLSVVRVVVALVGIVIWGYGYRVDDANVRLIGIGVLAVALVLRFVPKRWA